MERTGLVEGRCSEKKKDLDRRSLSMAFQLHRQFGLEKKKGGGRSSEGRSVVDLAIFEFPDCLVDT